MSPEVRMGVNDRTVRNIENLVYGDGKKSKGSELGVLLNVVVGASAD